MSDKRNDAIKEMANAVSDLLAQIKSTYKSPLLPPRALADPLKDFRSLQQQIKLGLEALKGSWAEAMLGTHLLLKSMREQSEREKKVERSGWLPHYTSPMFDLIGGETEIEISEKFQAYYSDNFDEVRRQFLDHLEHYVLDEEAKSVFREALECHARGAYRAAVRLLFPEIERVVCDDFHGGRTDQGIASIIDFRKAAGQLPIGEVLSFEHGLTLLGTLDNHLYVKVTAADIERFKANPVPNRHAAIHGIVSYSTMQNSINALITADLIFHLISAMKPYMVEEVD